MGLAVETEADAENQTNVVAISSDQLYVDEDAKFVPNNKGEAAAITMAKQAANTFV